MSSQTKPSWAIATIGGVCAINPKLDKSEIDGDREVSFVPMASVEAETGKIDVSAHRKFSAVEKGFTSFMQGDVLFAKITPCMENGKMAVAPEVHGGLGFGSTEFHVLRPASGIEASYIYYFVSGGRFRADAEHNMTGAVGQRRVPTTYITQGELPVPPTTEQKRIVAKIEELFSELDEGIANLKRARAQLAVYRQALLKHAFEGKLTAHWRATHAAQIESSDQLLSHIRAEREARYKQSQNAWQASVELWKAGGEKGAKPSKPRKPPEVALPTKEELAKLPVLPGGWTWTRLGSSNCDVFDGPFGSNLKTSDYIASGIRVVRLENIGALRFIEEKESFISEEKYRDLIEHTVFPGDIVFSSFVTEQTRVALVPKSFGKAINKADCFCVRLHGKTLLNRYAGVFLSTRFAYKQLEEVIHGVGRPRINTTQLKELFIPICASAEQHELMNIVDAQFSALDDLDNTLVIELHKSEALRQSILKKAFSGELVPQDPNDEPAADLLARIRTECAAQAAAPKPKKTRTAKA